VLLVISGDVQGGPSPLRGAGLRQYMASMSRLTFTTIMAILGLLCLVLIGLLTEFLGNSLVLATPSTPRGVLGPSLDLNMSPPAKTGDPRLESALQPLAAFSGRIDAFPANVTTTPDGKVVVVLVPEVGKLATRIDTADITELAGDVAGCQPRRPCAAVSLCRHPPVLSQFRQSEQTWRALFGGTELTIMGLVIS
jgi:hypothetical protein